MLFCSFLGLSVCQYIYQKYHLQIHKQYYLYFGFRNVTSHELPYWLGIMFPCVAFLMCYNMWTRLYSVFDHDFLDEEQIFQLSKQIKTCTELSVGSQISPCRQTLGLFWDCICPYLQAANNPMYSTCLFHKIWLDRMRVQDWNPFRKRCTKTQYCGKMCKGCSRCGCDCIWETALVTWESLSAAAGLSPISLSLLQPRKNTQNMFTAHW